MSAAIVRVESAAIEPQSMSELQALATAAAASKLFGVSTPEAALLLMMTGRDLGLSYPQALRAFHVVQGRPVLSAAGAVAICLKHKDICEHVRTIESSDTAATVEAKRVGDPPRRVTFTIDDARRAKLDGKDVWRSYPSRMLLARAQLFVCREVFPDLLLGLYDADEIEGPAPSPPRRVEVEARQVPAATPTPRSAQNPGPSLFDQLRAALVAVESAGELEGVRARLSAAKGMLTAEETGELSSLYRRTKDRVAPKPPAPVAESVPPPTQDEPAVVEAGDDTSEAAP